MRELLLIQYDHCAAISLTQAGLTRPRERGSRLAPAGPAVDETAILLHPPLTLAGASI